MYISPDFMTRVDEWLDSACSPDYQAQPLAQDWARVCKVSEELGEAVSLLTLSTGQNPRKPVDTDAQLAMLDELADVVVTATLAIQHFTKDTDRTNAIVRECILKIMNRLPPAYRDVV